jgi:hypothetical protein
MVKKELLMMDFQIKMHMKLNQMRMMNKEMKMLIQMAFLSIVKYATMNSVTQ